MGCHPTQVNTPPLIPGRGFTYPEGMEGWPRWPLTCRYGLPTHRRSPIKVQCKAGSRTRDLLITSPTP